MRNLFAIGEYAMRYRVKESELEWAVKCPAIGWIRIPRDGRWSFNGDYERPTFSPSVNETWGKEGQSMEAFKADPNPNRNHVIITDGKIEYCADCTHALAGQTVVIEPLTYAEARMCYGEKVQRDYDFPNFL